MGRSSVNHTRNVEGEEQEEVRYYGSNGLKKMLTWASLVAHWLRICLPMQGTRVRALVWEDTTYRGATGPVSHNS